MAYRAFTRRISNVPNSLSPHRAGFRSPLTGIRLQRARERSSVRLGEHDASVRRRCRDNSKGESMKALANCAKYLIVLLSTLYFVVSVRLSTPGGTPEDNLARVIRLLRDASDSLERQPKKDVLALYHLGVAQVRLKDVRGAQKTL